jgi:uncharacterized membrane protein
MRFALQRILIVFAISLPALTISTASAAPLSFTSAVLLPPPKNATILYTSEYDGLSAASGAAGFYHYSAFSGSVRWSLEGSLTVLPDPPAAIGTYAYGINGTGQVAGYTSFPGIPDRATVWGTDAVPRLLNAPGQSSAGNRAYAINDSGYVVGFAGQAGYLRAVRWAPNGTPTLLGQLPGQLTTTTQAYNINEAGQVVGYVAVGSGGFQRRAVRWSADGSPTVLGEVPGLEAIRSEPRDINDAGEAVGYGFSPTAGTFALRWDTDGSATLLGDLPGQTTVRSEAYSITDTGIVCGQIETEMASGFIMPTAAIWDPHGKATPLQDLMADGNTWIFSAARGIDRDGAAVRLLAFGSKNGEPAEWWLLTATVPEPTTGTLILFVATTLASTHRPRRVSQWLILSRSGRRISYHAPHHPHAPSHW